MPALKNMVRKTALLVSIAMLGLVACQYFTLYGVYRTEVAQLGALTGTESILTALRQQTGAVFGATAILCGLCAACVLLYQLYGYQRVKNDWTHRQLEMAVREQALTAERERLNEVYNELRRQGTPATRTGLQQQSTAVHWLDMHFDAFHRATLENLLDGEPSTAILFLGLDDVEKLYNEEHGRETVDAVLGDIGVQLENWVRQNDLVARWQDACFLMIMTRITLKDALLRAEDFRSALVSSPFEVDGVEVTASVSCGLSMMLTSDSSWRQSVERAKKALSRRKERGHNTLYHEIL